MRTPALLLAAFLATACSSGGTETPTTPSTPATAGSCGEVVKPNAPVTDVLIDQGCLDANGAKRIGTVKVCKDGRRLWKMGDFIGMSGGEMVPTDLQMEGSRADRILDGICGA